MISPQTISNGERTSSPLDKSLPTVMAEKTGVTTLDKLHFFLASPLIHLFHSSGNFRSCGRLLSKLEKFPGLSNRKGPYRVRVVNKKIDSATYVPKKWFE